MFITVIQNCQNMETAQMSTDGWTDLQNTRCSHTMEYYSVFKKNEVLVGYHLYVESKKYNILVTITK